MADSAEVQARCVLHHLPVLVLRGHVLFPGTRQLVHIQERAFHRLWGILRRRRAKGAPSECVGVIALRQSGQELYSVGTLCHVVSHTSRAAAAGGARRGVSVRLQLEGVGRFRVLRVAGTSSCPQLMDVRLMAEASDVPAGVSLTVLAHRVQEKLMRLSSHAPSKGRCWKPASALEVADMVGAAVELLTVEERQRLLEIPEPHMRLRKAEALLDVSDQRRKDAPRGTVVVRWPVQALCAPAEERLPAAHKADTEIGLVSQLALQLARAGLPVHAKPLAQRELRRLKVLRPDHPEYVGTQKYLETLASLPWQAATVDSVDLNAARASLDHGQHGLHRAKQRILEFLAVQKMRGTMCAAPVLCVAGPPGTGKTSLARSVAEALGRQFQRIALGGVRDEAELRGHRRTYIGSMPGAVMQAIQAAGTRNPVLLLDEVDKLGSDRSFNPSAVLLEVLDPEQNASFKDHYLNTAFDLSSVLFICTANDTSQIDRPLLDRMELIELCGYTVEEKVAIAEQHLLPKQRRLHGLQGSLAAFEPGGVQSSSAEFAPLVCLVASAVTNTQPQPDLQRPVLDMAASPSPPPPLLMITPAAILAIVTRWTNESGVRSLERRLAQICRWAVMHLQGLCSNDNACADGEVPLQQPGAAGGPLVVDEGQLASILGAASQSDDAGLARLPHVGVAVTLSPTAAGGVEPRCVEAARFAALHAGSGGLQITGVRDNGGGPSATRESALTAVSLLRHLADEAQFGRLWPRTSLGPVSAIQRAGTPFRDEQVHLNLASRGVFGAALVDDSSVGLAVLLALASLHLRLPLRKGIAALGEVTLRGQLLVPEGLCSIRDAVLAAQRAGFSSILLPEGCRRYVVEEVEASALRDLELCYIRRVEEVFEIAFGAVGAKEASLSAEAGAASEEWAAQASLPSHRQLEGGYMEVGLSGPSSKL